MGVNLVLLTDGTASNEMFHERGETRPPEVPLQDLLGMKDSHMS